MKKLLVLTAILCGYTVVYSQVPLEEYNKERDLRKELEIEVQKLKDSISTLQSVNTKEVDKLNSKISTVEKEKKTLNTIIEENQKEIQNLGKEKADLDKNVVKIDRDNLRKQVDTLNTIIANLNTTISEKEDSIAKEKQEGEQRANTEKENGRKEVLTSIADTYNSKKFEDLIKSSTKESVQRDKLLIGEYGEIRQVLDDLEKYFNAEELLSKKFDAGLVFNSLSQVKQLKHQSASTEKLMNKLENFKTFNDGLKETLGKLIELDKRESVEGMSDVVQKQKFNKIMSVLSEYIFGYDFNFTDYAYLTDIMVETIKRKQPNPDADISDLLRKLY